MRAAFISVLLIVMLILLALPLDIQGQNQENVRFSRLGLAHGLSHQELLSVAQDSQGFPWFGAVIAVTSLLLGLSIIVYVKKLRCEIRHSRRMQDQLEESEAQIRLLVENMGDMISRHNADSTITYVSPSCESLLGYRVDELLHERAGESVHPEDREYTSAVVNEATNKHDPHYLIQHRLRHKQGHYVWVETVGRLIYDRQGELCEIQCNVRDVTERKQAEDKILSYQAKLRSLASRLSVTEESIRKKAANILHDSIGQSLISCRLLLGAERRADLAPHLNETLDKVIETAPKQGTKVVLTMPVSTDSLAS